MYGKRKLNSLGETILTFKEKIIIIDRVTLGILQNLYIKPN